LQGNQLLSHYIWVWTRNCKRVSKNDYLRKKLSASSIIEIKAASKAMQAFVILELHPNRKLDMQPGQQMPVKLSIFFLSTFNI
jgi:hypothetical protein